MSKLTELIRELCPAGVEFRKLENCCTILDKKRKPVTKSARQSGKYPYYGANGIQDYVSEYIFDGTFILVGEDGTVQTIDGTPVVNWAEGKIWVNNHAHIIEEIEGILLRYLYHYIQIIDVRDLIHGNIPKLNQKGFRNLLIPVPPLPVQEEIVRILDNFSQLTEELIAKLKAELTARKKQYEYYRDKLLTFDPNVVEFRTIKSISKNIVSGGTPKTGHTEYYDGDIPWLRTQEINFNNIVNTEMKITQFGLDNSSAKWIPSNCVIVAMYGATVGKVGINKIPMTTNQACCNIEIDEMQVLYKYVFHVLCSQYKYIKSLGQGSQTNINAQIVKELIIPVPPIAEQERIVAILDRFDSLCNDLTSGLPAEIAARQKQYEYYRDQLLQFKPLKASS